MRLSTEKFLEIVRHTKLVAIDLVIFNSQEEIVMGYRINEPAKGTWFVPGGRIQKGETIGQALERISLEELGYKLIQSQVKFLGPYDHIYDTNFANEDGVKTEYVVFAYSAQVNLDLEGLPTKQHREWKWISKDSQEGVHKNASAYFSTPYTGAKYISCDDVTYEILNTRRDSFNQLLWETPALGLVAQAFLFTTILNAETLAGARQIASGLAFISSLACLQLLAKHRYNERELAIELHKIECSHERYPANRYLSSKNIFIQTSSYKIWSLLLTLFGLAALLVLIKPGLIS
jgi:colanic acid biosynthesis protein WcaH